MRTGRPTWSLIYARRRWGPDWAVAIAACIGGFSLGLVLANLLHA
jgi:hypothetical protein